MWTGSWIREVHYLCAQKKRFMSRVNKRKAYKSRRERAQRDWRNISILALFILIALVILFIKNGKEIFRWIGTYFY